MDWFNSAKLTEVETTWIPYMLYYRKVNYKDNLNNYSASFANYLFQTNVSHRDIH